MEEMYGIKYSMPKVVLLQETGIGVAETAARTCYDSFCNSENDVVQKLETILPDEKMCKSLNNIEESQLLDDLAWTYFHHSILEHANLSYLIRGTSRGVLQEHARHRIQAISVRSTRYTMSSILNAYVASLSINDRDSRFKFFFQKIDVDSLLVTRGHYNTFEVQSILSKLDFQRKQIGDEEFFK